MGVGDLALAACSSTRTMVGSGGVATRRAYRNTVGYSANVAGRVRTHLTACSSTISMVGSGGVATRRAYRNTVGYSAIVTGRVGDLDPDRLYFYRFVVC